MMVRRASRSGAEVGGLELVAKSPDPVDVAAATRIDAVPEDAGKALVIGGQGELGIMQLVEVGAKQGGAELGIVHRIVQVHPVVQ